MSNESIAACKKSFFFFTFSVVVCSSCALNQNCFIFFIWRTRACIKSLFCCVPTPHCWAHTHKHTLTHMSLSQSKSICFCWFSLCVQYVKYSRVVVMVGEKQSKDIGLRIVYVRMCGRTKTRQASSSSSSRLHCGIQLQTARRSSAINKLWRKSFCDMCLCVRHRLSAPTHTCKQCIWGAYQSSRV